MAIPDYQSMMLPLLRLSADGEEHILVDAIEELARDLKVSEDERRQMLPSGQARFDNRVAWARTYLKKAGLLEGAARGRFRISERGRQVLQGNPPKIDNRFLAQFPEFREFRAHSRGDDESARPIGDPSQAPETPEEILAASYQSLRQLLADDLLQRVRKLQPSTFERLVVGLLIAMGYGGSREDAGQAVGRSGDGGVDGIINEDRLGLGAIYIQAKRWERNIGRPELQAFAGSLMGLKASKGIFITTSQFSKDAIEYIGNIEKRVVLVDGKRLVELMIDHGIGVTEVNSYRVKKVDPDYFGGDE